mmetsp:Transcript_950/g.1335  ORF Transcript_950/g.1335 Transcript_950/m.1335 type:complete len:282 (-) Transcript_950:95-940(-)
MGKAFKSITPEQKKWIKQQKMFFVGTAALSSTGHVNISPKGQESFVVLDPNNVAYLDLTGSGSETSAHIAEKNNARVTIMFCAFEGAPKILRLFGKGETILSRDAHSSLKSLFPKHLVDSTGFRAIIKIKVHRVSKSCGYAVPLMVYKKDRLLLQKWANGVKNLGKYRVMKNSYSIDGLPSIGQVEQLVEKKGKKILPYGHEGYVYGCIEGEEADKVESDLPVTEDAAKFLKTERKEEATFDRKDGKVIIVEKSYTVNWTRDLFLIVLAGIIQYLISQYLH